MDSETSSQTSRDARAAARNELQPSSNEVSPDLAADLPSEVPSGQRSIDIATISAIQEMMSNSFQEMMNSMTRTLQQDMNVFRNDVTEMVHRENSLRTPMRAELSSSSSSSSASSVPSNSHTVNERTPMTITYPTDMRSPTQSEQEAFQQPYMVHEKSYRKTTEEVSKSAKSLKISSNSADINRKIEAFNNLLNSTSLLTMLNGQRSQPMMTDENPNGFSPRAMRVKNDIATIEEADDIFLYAHDAKRLFQLMILFFDETLFYHCTAEIKSGNGIIMYNKIIAKVQGRALRDIDNAQKALEQFKIASSKPLPSELAKLEEIFVRLEHAQQTPLTDFTKKNCLAKLVLADPRSLLHSHVTNAHAPGITYDIFRDTLCDIYDNLPATYQTFKMAAMTDKIEKKGDKPKQICFNHQKGKCSHGVNCKYSHDIPGKKAPAGDNVKGKPHVPAKAKTPGFDFSNVHLTDKAKKQIGEPTSIPAIYNQRGYSNAQKIKIKAFLAYEASEDNESHVQWGQEEFINMMRYSNDEDQSTLPTSPEPSSNPLSTPSDAPPFTVSMTEDTAPHTPHKRMRDWEGMTLKDSHQKVTTVGTYHASTATHSEKLEQTLQVMRNMDDKISRVVPSVFNKVTRQHDLYVIYCSPNIHVFGTDKSPAIPILAMFGWTSRNNIRLAFTDNLLMCFPDVTSMALIHSTGSEYFDAIIIPRVPAGTNSDDQQSELSAYNTYQPENEPVYNGVKEIYVSRFTSIREYFSELTALDENTILTPGARRFLYCVLIYDFMSYISMRFATSCRVNEYKTDMDLLDEARKNLLSDLYHVAEPTYIGIPIVDAFRAIILSILPSKTHWIEEPADAPPTELEPAVLTLHENQSTPVHTSSSSSSAPQSTPRTPSRRQNRIYIDLVSPGSPVPCSPIRRLNVLIQHSIGTIQSRKPSRILDTGATVCGAGQHELLNDITQCTGITVQGAFGKPFQPTSQGTILGGLKLPCLRLPGNIDTLVSVSALCKKGYVVLFTEQGSNAYSTDSVRKEIIDMARNGREVIRGEQRDGLYHMIPIPSSIKICSTAAAALPVPRSDQSPVAPSSVISQSLAHIDRRPSVSIPTKQRVLYANARPTSTYEHVHSSLGHPGKAGMEWHRKNTPGAAYTDEDANKPRGLCAGCVLGGMRQASTDHRRVSRPPPTRPGQQFVLDAFTCTSVSRTGFKYCDIFTDLFTKIRHPVFMKTRSSPEICDKTDIFFSLHPDWKTGTTDRYMLANADNDAEPPDSRFIRADAEASYMSTDFLHCAAKHRYTLERTPPRDKHANGVAERSVGLVTLKTNVIILSPTPPVPMTFWDYAMAYACDTLSFCLTKSIRTSPYTFLHKAPVPLKFLQPFWTPCYVHHDQKNCRASSVPPVLVRPDC